jgi:hypothetical protein
MRNKVVAGSVVITPKGSAGGGLCSEDGEDYICVGLYDRGNNLIGERRIYMMGSKPVDIIYEEEPRDGI